MDIPAQNPHTKPTQPRTKAMQPTIEPLGATQRALLRALLHNQPGLTIDALGDTLAISRNAVRQHIAALERDGLLARGATGRSSSTCSPISAASASPGNTPGSPR